MYLGNASSLLLLNDCAVHNFSPTAPALGQIVLIMSAASTVSPHIDPAPPIINLQELAFKSPQRSKLYCAVHGLSIVLSKYQWIFSLRTTRYPCAVALATHMIRPGAWFGLNRVLITVALLLRAVPK